MDILTKLRTLGLKEYESKVFLVLLKGSLMSASEIAKKSNVPRPKVYEVLRSFVERGYCNEIETNSIMMFQLIDPVIIADKMEKELHSNYKKNLEGIKDSFEKLEPLYKTEEDDESKITNIEVVRGFNQHRHTKFIELFKKAKKEIHFMIRLEGYVSDEIDAIAKKFFKNGGKIHSLYEASYNFRVKKDGQWSNVDIGDLISICRKFESYGEDLRISETRLPNMTIFDRETVFLNVQDKTIPRHNEADIIIHNKAYAENMIDYFERVRKDSYTINEFEAIKTKGINEVN